MDWKSSINHLTFTYWRKSLCWSTWKTWKTRTDSFFWNKCVISHRTYRFSSIPFEKWFAYVICWKPSFFLFLSVSISNFYCCDLNHLIDFLKISFWFSFINLLYLFLFVLLFLQSWRHKNESIISSAKSPLMRSERINTKTQTDWR